MFYLKAFQFRSPLLLVLVVNVLIFASATLANAQSPDLTAGIPTDPGVVAAGAAIGFTGPITNAEGAGNVSGSFNNLFEIDVGNDNPDSDGDGEPDYYDIVFNAPNSITGLTAGQTDITSPPSPPWSAVVGTHAVRLCADLNSSFVGTVAESNENNNCGENRIFTVGIPDLISQLPPLGPFTEFESVQFGGEVKNQGNAVATAAGWNWSQVGRTLSLSRFSAGFATLDSSLVAFMDSTYGTLRGYISNGTDWFEQGTTLPVGAISVGALATLIGTTDVAFIDAANDQLRTYRFGDLPGNWSQVGNALPISVGPNPAIAALNATDVALIQGVSGPLRTYRFDGTNWSQVGNGLLIKNFGGPFGFSGGTALATLNATDVAFVGFFEDTFDNQLRTYRWDGTNWSQVGNSLSLNSAGIPALAALPNSTDVVFGDDNTHQLRTYHFDGTNWSQVGNSLSVPSIAPLLTALNATDVAVYNNNNLTLRTYRFANGGPFLVRFCVDNPNCFTNTTGRIGVDLSVDALVPLASLPLNPSVFWGAGTAGVHTLYLCADVENVVVESAEGSVSNCTSQSFTVLGAPERPDIVVTRFTVPDGGPGQVVNARVTIRNDSTVAITTPFKVAVQVDWLGPSTPNMACNAPISGSVTVPSLGAGATRPVNVRVTLPSPPSTQTYTAATKADWECVIDEYDESESDLTDDYVVTVGAVALPPEIISFNTQDGSHLVKKGKTKVLEWEVINATRVEITGSDGFSYVTDDLNDSIVTPAINGRTTYTIMVWNGYPSGQTDGPESFTISIVPEFIEF